MRKKGKDDTNKFFGDMGSHDGGRFTLGGLFGTIKGEGRGVI